MEAICVSGVPSKPYLWGREVLPFDRIRNRADALFIIAVNRKGTFYTEIEKRLLAEGIKNYMAADTIVDYFT